MGPDTADEALPTTFRPARSLSQHVSTNSAPLRPDDPMSWTDNQAIKVRDADGRHVWLALLWRKRSELRWDVHLLPFNLPVDPASAVQPIAELDFGRGAAGTVRMPQVEVSVPATVDGQGQATLPIERLVVDFAGTTLNQSRGSLGSFRQSGWGIHGVVELDFLTLRAREDFVGIEVSPSDEVSSWSRGLVSGQQSFRVQGHLFLAPPQSCTTACDGLRYGRPGSDGFGQLRSGWIETANP